ncbi:MAG: hypothetical protein ABJD97_16890 [Betaproteobacteria bacterium]
MHSDSTPSNTRIVLPASRAGGLARDDTHWWTAYALHSAVDGAERDRPRTGDAPERPSDDDLTTWWNEIAGARMPMAVFDAPHDATLQYLVSGHGTRYRQELMIERLDSMRVGAHAERLFFRRLREPLAAWGRWSPI